uniref:SpoIIE family protein phosphatase n=1 Tax=Nocardioides sp. TaxID=35761 RepID=UPI0025DB3591
GCGPDDALAAVGGLVPGLPRAAATTIVLAIVGPETGELTYCTAGHPAPLVVDPVDGARRLPPTGAAALGLGSTYPTLTHTLEPGQMLALHSDAASGATRSGRTLCELTHAVVGSLGGGHGIRGTVDRVCERVLADVAPGGPRDDVVLLGAERMPSAPPLELHLPATAAAVREARIRLADWLDDLRPGELDVSALLHAAGELVSNAVEHAYADSEDPGPGAVVVRAHLSAVGEVVLTIHDGGRWRPADERAGRGRGLAMAGGLIDHLELDRRHEGTVATIHHRIGRPVTMFRSPTSVPEVHRGAALDVAVVGPGRVRVGGEVDGDAAGVLRVALLHHTRVGTAPLVVDLSPAALLTSAGVRVLAEAMSWGSGSASLSLVAAAGSVAEQVLGAAGIPCSTA